MKERFWEFLLTTRTGLHFLHLRQGVFSFTLFSDALYYSAYSDICHYTLTLLRQSVFLLACFERF